MSKTAFEHIETKLPLGYEYLGEQTVKNIAKPVGAYRVLMDPRVTVAGAKEVKPSVPVWSRKGMLTGAVKVLLLIIGLGIWHVYFRTPKIEPASQDKMIFPLPDKPSIAVLPFENMSGNPEEEYIADGITENIISYLCKIPEMFVIDRKSTSTYKNRAAKIRTVSEELEIKYVLTGSVQKSGDKLRVATQLVDALKGRTLWSERYERDFHDLFTLQDEITLNILKEMQVRLARGEIPRWQITDNIEAWGYFIRGAGLAEKVKKEKDL